MSGATAWLSDVGRQTQGVFWEPVLVWTALALAGWAVLSRCRGLHPVVQEKVRSALLLALPVGVVLALLGEVGWVAVPHRPLPVVSEWVASREAANATVAIPAGPGDPAPDAGSRPGIPATFWLGCMMLLAAGASAAYGVKSWLDGVALARLRRRLRFVDLRDLVDPAAGMDAAPRRVRFALAPDDAVPMTFGTRRPVVVVPQALLQDPAALRLAIEHELNHVRRGDALLHLLEHLVAILFAVHPLVHFLRAETVRFREMACDAEVLGRARCRPRDYAAVLLRFAESRTPPAVAPGMFGAFTHLKQRILAMNLRRENPVQLRRARRAGATLGLLVLLVTIGIVACSDLAPDPPAANPDATLGRVVFRQGSVEDALRDARDHYAGRLLVYFASDEPAVSRRVERHLFANSEYADLVNATFARYTVPVDSPEGLDVMRRYNVTSRTTSPLLMILNGEGRAVLMTTLGEVDSPASASRKMMQILETVGLDPARLRLRTGLVRGWHLTLSFDSLEPFMESGAITPDAARLLLAEREPPSPRADR